MKAASFSTQAADAYRAGIELGTALAPLQPEIVFLFATVHYAEDNRLVQGLRDALASPDTLVVGSTGDGFYHQNLCGDIGCVAMGLNGEGQVRWRVTRAEGLQADPAGCLERAWGAMQAALGDEPARLLWLFSDFRADASELEAVLRDRIPVPVVGGLAADDNQLRDCALFCNEGRLRDSLVLVSVSGALEFRIRIANSLVPVGKPGRIDVAEGKNLLEIDGVPAMEFIERETGKPVLQSDRSVLSLTVIGSDGQCGRRLRSIVPDFAQADGAVGLYGGIRQGERVQVCEARPERLIEEVWEIARDCGEEGFAPACALIVSCVGRKYVLGERIQCEVDNLTQHLDFGLPIAGFPSFGEIAPLPVASGYSQNLFHNMTYVLLLIGR